MIVPKIEFGSELFFCQVYLYAGFPVICSSVPMLKFVCQQLYSAFIYIETIQLFSYIAKHCDALILYWSYNQIYLVLFICIWSTADWGSEKKYFYNDFQTLRKFNNNKVSNTTQEFVMVLELIMWSQGQWKASEKNAPYGVDIQSDIRTDMAILWLNRPSGADSVKITMVKIVQYVCVT